MPSKQTQRFVGQMGGEGFGGRFMLVCLDVVGSQVEHPDRRDSIPLAAVHGPPRGIGRRRLVVTRCDQDRGRAGGGVGEAQAVR
jgi:hypothetical protein